MRALVLISIVGFASAILPKYYDGARIVGGNPAGPGQFPYIVGLFQSSSSQSPFCGGSYIGYDDSTGVASVVTAAHCVDGMNTNSMRVAFGLLDLDDMANNAVFGSVLTSVMHPSYDRSTLDSDVAILKVYLGRSRDDLENRDITRVDMPTSTYNDRETAVVSGWGTLRYGGRQPDTLYYVEKPILSLDDCRSTSYDPSEITNNMMCSGQYNKDACQGDSGGPLVVNRGGRNVLVGVVSWGFGCGFRDYPGVYADVYRLRNWINNNA